MDSPSDVGSDCGCRGYPRGGTVATIFPKKCCRYPPHRGLGPSHKALYLDSSPAIRPQGAPRTQGHDVRTALSIAANLTPRHTPAAAARCESRWHVQSNFVFRISQT